MAMKESNLGYAIQMQPNLRYRIEAIVKDRWWDTPGVDPTRPVPIEDIAWAVVADDTVRAKVKEGLNPEEPNVGLAVEGIPDNLLAPAVYRALTRLDEVEAARKAEQEEAMRQMTEAQEDRINELAARVAALEGGG